jgi:hypothetical protein
MIVRASPNTVSARKLHKWFRAAGYVAHVKRRGAQQTTAPGDIFNLLHVRTVLTKAMATHRLSFVFFQVCNGRVRALHEHHLGTLLPGIRVPESLLSDCIPIIANPVARERTEAVDSVARPERCLGIE